MGESAFSPATGGTGRTVKRDDRSRDTQSRRALSAAVTIWFLTVAAGQWTFIFYLVTRYAAPAVSGGLEAWPGNNLATGYVPSDPVGNLAAAAHVFLAIPTLAAGQLQLLPRVRSSFPRLHRWSGRFYLSTAVAGSLTGLYMVWVRGNPQAGLAEHVGTSLGAALIIAFAALTLRAVAARDIAAHRCWAVRLFMTVSGVWFIRIGYGLWFFSQGADAPPPRSFSIFISYAQYAVPLALLELYRASGRNAPARIAMALLIALLTALTAIGLFEATRVLWLPRVA